MVCILMGMRERTWWNIGEGLWNVGWDMSDNSIDGTTMGQNSHAQMDSQSLVPLDAFASSWSRMTNQHSSRMMNTTRGGAMQLARRSQRPMVMANR